MKRLGSVWLVFGLCVALAAWAMARLGGMALELERAEAKATRQAALEENLQLALWRMDSALAPLMAEESARPYFTYSPLYPAERAFTRMFAEIDRGDVLMPSPLLTFTSPQIRLHFQYGPDGRLSSPQVPAGNMRDLAENRYLSPELVEGATRRLAELDKLINRQELAAALRVDDPNSQAMAVTTLAELQKNPSRSSSEFIMRSRNSKVAQSQAPAEALPLATRTALSQGPLQGIWIGPTLLLARRAARFGRDLSSRVLARLGRDSCGPHGAGGRPSASRAAGTGARPSSELADQDARIAAGATRAWVGAG